MLPLDGTVVGRVLNQPVVRRSFSLGNFFCGTYQWRPPHGIIEARPGMLGGARFRIPLFPTLTSAAADRKMGTSSVPAPTPTDENRARRGSFRAEASRMSFSEPLASAYRLACAVWRRCFALRLALRLLVRIAVLALAVLFTLWLVQEVGKPCARRYAIFARNRTFKELTLREDGR
jgi:hypothetical protein